MQQGSPQLPVPRRLCYIQTRYCFDGRYLFNATEFTVCPHEDISRTLAGCSDFPNDFFCGGLYTSGDGLMFFRGIVKRKGPMSKSRMEHWQRCTMQRRYRFEKLSSVDDLDRPVTSDSATSQEITSRRRWGQESRHTPRAYCPKAISDSHQSIA